MAFAIIASRVKSLPINSLLLLAILGFYGWHLGRDYLALRKWPENQANLSARNNTLVFRTAAGIDIHGNHIVDSAKASGVKRTVGFLIRTSHVRRDVEFISRVQQLLASRPEIRVVAFCDGIACSHSGLVGDGALGFPIIAYGEVVSTEAVVNADALGLCVMRDSTRGDSRRTSWRSEKDSPATVVQELER